MGSSELGKRQRHDLQNEYVGQAEGKFAVCGRETIKNRRLSCKPCKKGCDSEIQKKTHTFGSLIGTMLMQCQKITGLVFLHKIAQSITCQLSYLLIQHVKGTLWGETVLGWSRKCNNVVSI